MKYKYFLPIKNGIKSVLRTPVKTALFLILLTIATVFMSVGIGLYCAALNMLNQADETFITVGEFTFTGGYYPRENFYDPFLFAIQENFSITDLEDVKGVIATEENIRLRATIEDYPGTRSVMPYKEESIFIATVSDLKDMDKRGCYTIIKEYLYAYNDKNGNHIYVNPPIEGFIFEQGHTYLFTGSFKFAYLAKSFYPENYKELLRSDEEYPSIVDITEFYPDNMEEFYLTDIGKYYMRAAEMLDTVNNAVNIVATSNIEATDPFQRGEFTIIKGDYFNEDDYIGGGKCIIPQGISAKMRLNIGDKISLNIHYPSNDRTIFDSFLPEEGFAAYEMFEIAGIYQSETFEPYIYIANTGQSWAEKSKSDYSLGRVIIENSKRREFEDYLDKINFLLPDVRLNIYDQGYEEAVMPILSMMDTAKLIIFVCALFCFLLILFFGFFFVYRNAQTVTTLMNLGTGYNGTFAFLLSGCGLISAFSSTLGSAIGFVLSANISRNVFQQAMETLDFDLRFSQRGSGIKSEIFAPVLELSPFVYGVFAVIIFIFTLVVCGVFSFETIRKQNPMYKFKYKFKQQSKLDNKKIPSKGLPKLIFVDIMPFTSLRYAVKSLIRGNSRSVVIPIIFLSTTIFINVFFTIKSDFENRLDTVYEDIPVNMQFTDSKGRKIDNIITKPDVIQEMLDSGFVSDYWYCLKTHYDYNGRILRRDGTPDSAPLKETVIPSMEYPEKYQHFLNDIDKNFNYIVWTNNISHAPEFYYSKNELKINYATGLSRENLVEPKYEEEYMKVMGFVSTDFLEKYDLEVGDTLAVTLLNYVNIVYASRMEFFIAGSYKQESVKEIIYMYVPLNHTKISYSTGFQVKDPKNISEFKDWLCERYDEVNTISDNRRWIVIDDMPLYRTIQSIERYINYINITYPFILLLILATGFFVANTLMKSRLWEIAVMQGVGNSRLSIFSSFMAEQILLSIPGLVGGFLISYFINYIIINIANILIFILCYYIGAGAAVIQAQKISAIKSLKENVEQ